MGGVFLRESEGELCVCVCVCVCERERCLLLGLFGDGADTPVANYPVYAAQHPKRVKARFYDTFGKSTSIKKNIPVTPSGIEPATSWLAALCLDQLRHSVVELLITKCNLFSITRGLIVVRKSLPFMLPTTQP